jgi:hypothetical protein
MAVKVAGYGAGASIFPGVVAEAGRKLGTGIARYEQGDITGAVGDLTDATNSAGFAIDTGKATAEQTPRIAREIGSTRTAVRAGEAIAPYVAPVADKAGKVVSAVSDAVAAPFKAGYSYWNPEAAMTPEQAATMAFRPRNSKTNWQAEVQSALPDARRAADTMGIDTNGMTLDDALKAVNQAKKDVWGEYQQQFLDANSDHAVSAQPIADALRGQVSDMTREQNPGLAKKIEQVAKTYDGRTLTVQELQDRVSQLNNQTRAIEARYVTDKRAAKQSPQNAYVFAQRDGLRTLLDSTIEAESGPGGSDLRKRWGALTSLEDVISRRIPVADRQAPESLPKTLAKAYAAGRIARGMFTLNPMDIMEGGVSLLSQRHSAKLNDPDYLTQVAFNKTTPRPPAATPAEYMPEPGAHSNIVPRFGQRQLPPATREYGVPENPNVDQVDNRDFGNSVTPVGAAGKDGVLLHPAGLLPEARFPGETPEPRPLRIGGRVPPDNSRALPPISLPESNATPSNLEAVGMPETAEETAIRRAVAQGRGRFGQRVPVAASRGGANTPPFEQAAQAPQVQSSPVAIERNPEVQPDKRQLEEETIRYTQQNLPALMEEYNRRHTQDGLLTVDADKAKELLPQRGGTDQEVAANTTAVHKSSAAIAREVMSQELEKPVDPSKPVVRFVTGIPGSGKSFQGDNASFESTGIVRHGLMDDFPSASEKINAVLASGRVPIIHAVMTDPMVAFERTVKRAVEEGGRVVPVNAMAQAVKGIVPTIKQITEHYGDAVKISLLDNSVNDRPPTPISLNDLDDYAYNGSAKELAHEFQQHLDKLRQRGEVPSSIYDAIVRGAGSDRGRWPAGNDRQRGPETGGDEGSETAPPIDSGTGTPPMPPTSGGNRVSGERVPVSTAKVDKAFEPGEQIAGTTGGDTSLLTSSGKLPAKYRIVDVSDLKPSHDAMSFAKNPDYPEGVQERAYHTSKEAQNRVIQQSQNYDPAYTVNSNPDAVNGPPIITPDGTVLGGNSRAMSTQRIYQADAADGYRDYLRKSAGAFGLKPEDVDSFEHPVLVREVPAPATIEETRRLGSELNKSMTGALGVSEKAVSAGKSITPETLSTIGTMLDAPDTTLRSAMAAHGPDFIKMLTEDGVITDRERPAFVDTATGGLSDEGKTFIERALRGFIVDDPDLMDATPKSVLNKLDGSLADAVALGQRSDEYNILPLLREALAEHAEIARKGTSVAMYYGEHIDKNFGKVKQESIFQDEKNPAVKALVQLLGDKQAAVRSKIRQFTQDAKYDQPVQGMLMMGEQPSAAKAFNDAFGTSFSDTEYADALEKAYAKHADSSTIQRDEVPDGKAGQNLRPGATPSESVRGVAEGDAQRTAARRTGEDGTKGRTGVKPIRTGKRT